MSGIGLAITKALGIGNGPSVPQDYSEMRQPMSATNKYLSNIISMAKSYAKKSEKLAKMQQELGTCLVDVGMQEKDQWFGETLMRLGETLKSLAMINHALDVNLVEKSIRPCMSYQEMIQGLDKSHNRYVKKQYFYDDKKRVSESLKDPSKRELALQDLQKIEEERNEAYAEASKDLQDVSKRRSTDHVIHILELVMSFHYYHYECYSLTNGMTDFFTKIKDTVKSRKGAEAAEKKASADKSGASESKKGAAPVAPQGSLSSRAPQAPVSVPAPPPPPPDNSAANNSKAAAIPMNNSSSSSKKAAPPSAPAVTKAAPSNNNNSNSSSKNKVEALYDFEGTEEDELSFKKGDVINLVSKEDGTWWIGELRGKTGSFPYNYVMEKSSSSNSPSPSASAKKGLYEVVALYEHNAEDDSEISFKPGDRIQVLDDSDPGWHKGEIRGQIGLFPSNYTKKV